jgi:hypothetical protein
MTAKDRVPTLLRLLGPADVTAARLRMMIAEPERLPE